MVQYPIPNTCKEGQVLDPNLATILSWCQLIYFSNHRAPDVGLRHPPVPLHHDQLAPDVILDGVPLAVDLVDVILILERMSYFQLSFQL